MLGCTTIQGVIMNIRTPLANQPAMNALPIGPDGQTFGQLRQAVLDAREAYTRCPGDSPALADLGDKLAAAHEALRAAYELVGLPYVTP